MRRDKTPRTLLRQWVAGVLASLAAVVGMAGEPPQDKVPLILKLPMPRFMGTPHNLKGPHLEKPRSGKRPDLAVPAGLTHVALNKPVTASDTAPTLGELSQVTDGDKDGVEGSYVEIGPGKQYFESRSRPSSSSRCQGISS